MAREGTMVGANVLAACVLDLLTSPELLAAAKKQFEEDTKETKYFSLLPPGAKPPVDFEQRHHGQIPTGYEEILSEQERSV